MIPNLSAQQLSFFTKNGFLELEGFLDPHEIKQIADLKSGHDLWRTNLALKRLLLSRKMGSVALSLLSKDRLMLAFDRCIPTEFSLDPAEKIKNLFSVQGIVLIVFFQAVEPPIINAPKLGHPPYCNAIGNILLVRPDLLISWPKSSSPIYLAAYCNTNAVYVENPHDLAAEALKQMGYEYGDVLRAKTHPLLQRTDHR